MDKLNRLEKELKRRLVGYKMRRGEVQEKENFRLVEYYNGLIQATGFCIDLIDLEKKGIEIIEID